MTARIGPDDLGMWESPQASLLKEISGIEPEASGVHVLLDEHASVRSTQRLALSDVGGCIIVAMWPGELKSQALHLYSQGRGIAMVEAAREREWEVRARPCLAFFNARPSLRLYMAPEVPPEEYAARWEGADGRRIGEHSADELQRELWPWLKQRGYASASDDAVLEQFILILGRRKAHLRPGLQVRRRWNAGETRDRRSLASQVRQDVNAILAAAGEPTLPVSA